MAVDKERISALKFDEKFKNALRDYYNYGFKSFKDYKGDSSRVTARKDWARLNRILADHEYMDWAEDASDILFVTADSQAMRENPFHSVYRFCGNKRTAFFLYVIAALSADFHPTFLNKKLLSRLIGKSNLPDSAKTDLRIYLEDAAGLEDFLSYVEELSREWDRGFYPDKDDSTANSLVQNEMDMLQRAAGSQFSPDGLKTSEFFEDSSVNEKASRSAAQNKTINERLDALVSLGVVRCRQTRGEKGSLGDRHYRLSDMTMKNMIETCAKVSGDPSSNSDAGTDQELKMKNDVKTSSETISEFVLHLRTALDFYSRYFPFGETGTYLLDRIGLDDAVSPFRFKHEYFMQAINDFNRLDLLAAMEEKKWCRILWNRGDQGRSTETMAFPLEIRVSSSTGRETLFYYDVLDRSLQAIRLEFIDNIFIYSDAAVKKVLAGPDVGLKPDQTEADIAKARSWMENLWGTALAPNREQNLLKDPPLRPVRLVLTIDPKTQGYIRTRLYRECRGGKVTESENGKTISFETQVFDTTELRSWVRSFYSFIRSCEGMDAEEFSPAADVEEMAAAMDAPCPEVVLKNKTAYGEGTISSPDGSAASAASTARVDVCALFGEGERARAHEQIFHEIFSVYTAVGADVFVRLAKGEDSGKPGFFMKKDLDRAISKSLDRYYLLIGSETEDILPDEIRNDILSEDLASNEGPDVSKISVHPNEIDGYRLRYHCGEDVDFYRDVLPLTDFERRWLETVLHDEKIGYFLSEEETAAMEAFLRSGENPAKELPMDKIVPFDRFNPLDMKTDTKSDAKPGTKSDVKLETKPDANPGPDSIRSNVNAEQMNTNRGADREKTGGTSHETMRILLSAIDENRMVNLRYKTNRQKEIAGRFAPLYIEYSKRSDRFQAYLLSEKNGLPYAMNLFQIEEITLTETKFDRDKAEERADDVRQKDPSSSKSVTITFYNTRKMADRILTEFSPWQKRCSYDKQTGLYTLTVYYQRQDEAELVIRLMGYGPHIRFADREHTICREIRRRLDRQRELFSKE